MVMASSSTTNEYESVADSEKKIVFTEIGTFFLALQHDGETQAPHTKDAFMDVPNTYDNTKEEQLVENHNKEGIAPTHESTIHEVAVGKGLAGALKLLKERGALDLKESVEYRGGRNTDKKKSSLARIYDNEGTKEIHIQRTDEYGRMLTPKESFRLFSHKFHGKVSGKKKQEKRKRQEELQVKQMKNPYTPTHSIERMIEAQVQQKSPYLVQSGHVKHQHNSHPRSGFATDFPGGLTPMPGDKKVAYLPGKRNPKPGDICFQKKPKT